MSLFYPEPMRFIRIIVLKKDRDRAIAILQRLGTLDLRKSGLKLPDDTESAAYADALPRLLWLVQDAVSILPKAHVSRMRQLEPGRLVKAVGKELDAIGRIQELGSRRKELEQRIIEMKKEGDDGDVRQLRREVKAIGYELDEISSRHYSKLACFREMLEMESAKAAAALMFKRTKSTCIIEGWVPARDEREMRDALESGLSGKCTIERVRTKEEQPTYYRVPWPLSSFNYLVNLYSTPRNDELNPAWFLMISFPVLYGLMVNDAGYGLVSLLISIVIARRTGRQGMLHNMANVWLLASAFAILFGLVSDQFFGFQIDRYIFPTYHAFDWTANIKTVIAASVLIGIAQISIGLCLGIWNNMVRRRPRYAAAKALLLITLVSGAVAVSGLLFHAVSHGTAVESAVISVLSMMLLLAVNASQWGRLIDMIVYPISYVRIMGFGFASILLASIINDAFTPDIHSGVGVFALYVVIFVALHMLNMAMSTLEGAIQSVRLNFLEFFEEFYTGKGTKYAPFSYARAYTTE